MSTHKPEPKSRDKWIKMLEEQEAEAYARQPQTDEELTAWEDIEAWEAYETRA